MNSRMCISCRKKSEKLDFLRIVRKKEQLFFDKNYDIDGRGVYICKNEKCLSKAFFAKKNKNAVEFHLKVKSSKELEDELRNAL